MYCTNAMFLSSVLAFMMPHWGQPVNRSSRARQSPRTRSGAEAARTRAARFLLPVVEPGVVEIEGLFGFEVQLPGDAPNAVEVGPPVGPVIIAPPGRKVVAAGEVAVVLEDIHHLRDPAVIGLPDIAQHVARDLQIDRLIAIVREMDGPGEIDAHVVLVLPGDGVGRALGLLIGLLDA